MKKIALCRHDFMISRALSCKSDYVIKKYMRQRFFSLGYSRIKFVAICNTKEHLVDGESAWPLCVSKYKQWNFALSASFDLKFSKWLFECETREVLCDGQTPVNTITTRVITLSTTVICSRLGAAIKI